jgi:putative MATE family efflux protein
MIISYILPIAMQQIMTTIHFILDNFLVASMGSTEIAALGSSSRFLFILRFGILAFSIANAVISAQIKDDKLEIRRYLSKSILSGIMFTIIFISIYVIFKDSILGSFTPSLDIQRESSKYISILILSGFTLSFFMPLITSLRSLGDLKISAIVTSIGLASHIFINLKVINSSIFNNLDKIYGLAIGSVVSEIIMVTILIVYLYRKHNILPITFNLNGAKIIEYMRSSLTILLSHMIWALHVMLMHNLFGRLGSVELTAIGIVSTFEVLIFDLASSLGSTALVALGRPLSQNDKPAAYSIGVKMLKTSAFVGLIVGLSLFTISGLISNIFSITQVEKDLVIKLLTIHSIFQVIKFINATLYNGILRSGGDVFYVMLLTTFLAWGLIIPITHIGHFYFGWRSIEIYFALHALELVTFTLMLIRFNSRVWIKNLSQE